MTLKDILAKMTKGEPLTDEEKTFITSYDPDKDKNDVAAAARKSAEAKAKALEKDKSDLEAKLAELQASLDAASSGKQTDVEKLQKELDKINAKLTEKDKAFQALDAEKKKLIRDGKLSKISGTFKFTDGFDAESASMLVSHAFSDLKDEELDDETLVKAHVQTFRDNHKGVLIDQSGHGSGNPQKGGGEGNKGKMFTLEEIKAMSPEDFNKNKAQIWAGSQEIKEK